MLLLKPVFDASFPLLLPFLCFMLLGYLKGKLGLPLFRFTMHELSFCFSGWVAYKDKSMVGKHPFYYIRCFNSMWCDLFDLPPVWI
jgi:hypothetical protein